MKNKAELSVDIVSTGRILWFTGLSGAGKTTLAQRLESTFVDIGYPVQVLDGNVVRNDLCRGLGFSKEDRIENIRRVGVVARMLAKHGVIVIVAAITPYKKQRSEQAVWASAEGIPFSLIYTSALLDNLIARDPKGLYKKALGGKIDHFTGISDPYESPVSADVVVDTDEETVEESTRKILRAFVEDSL